MPTRDDQHDYICDVDTVECLVCGAVEVDGEPWLPQHFEPEDWED